MYVSKGGSYLSPMEESQIDWYENHIRFKKFVLKGKIIIQMCDIL